MQHACFQIDIESKFTTEKSEQELGLVLRNYEVYEGAGGCRKGDSLQCMEGCQRGCAASAEQQHVPGEWGEVFLIAEAHL